MAHSRSTATVAIISTVVCLGRRGCLPFVTISLFGQLGGFREMTPGQRDLNEVLFPVLTE